MPPAEYLRLMRDHLDAQLATGTDTYGADYTPMWMASLDTHTGRYPANDARPASVGKRVYRNIDAPRGSSLYWDQPLIVASHALSARTGEPRYSEAADAYTAAFLQRCVAPNGMFLWGNHYYYDAFSDCVRWFHGEEEPLCVDMAAENGHLHEARPIPPAWETFWRLSPAATERCIRRLAEMHVTDPESGAFNRHADRNPQHAFLEAGGILVETFCWLAARIGDGALRDLALRVAQFSWGYRTHGIDLPAVSPLFDRWDRNACTTEVGLWASSLLRAVALGGPQELGEIAATAVAAYISRGFDAFTGLYYGRLRVRDGSPILGERTTPYQPGDYADPWLALFPAHDYPIALAEACVALYRRTGEDVYALGIRRWARALDRVTPANGGRGAYAEHYGRAIHFLVAAAEVLDASALRAQAEALAEEAVRILYVGPLFRTHPDEDRYDAVDGLGYLFLALLRLEAGEEAGMMGC